MAGDSTFPCRAFPLSPAKHLHPIHPSHPSPHDIYVTFSPCLNHQSRIHYLATSVSTRRSICSHRSNIDSLPVFITIYPIPRFFQDRAECAAENASISCSVCGNGAASIPAPLLASIPIYAESSISQASCLWGEACSCPPQPWGYLAGNDLGPLLYPPPPPTRWIALVGCTMSTSIPPPLKSLPPSWDVPKLHGGRRGGRGRGVGWHGYQREHLKSPSATASERRSTLMATVVFCHRPLCTEPNSPSPTFSLSSSSSGLISYSGWSCSLSYTRTYLRRSRSSSWTTAYVRRCRPCA